MIPKIIGKIDAADIQALVINGDEERRTMEFKRDLPGNADKDKYEARADVTSFANAGGGDLIFGVEEAGGVASAVLGLPGVDADAQIRRIEAIIQTSIDPRVPGIESRAISIPGKGPVIVVRVPKSWRGPHLVKINDTFRMFGRNSKGKYIFDATEIRSAFVQSEQLNERMRRWRDDRIAKIIGGDAPVPLEDGARLFIHLLPVSSFAGSMELSAGEIKAKCSEFDWPGKTGVGSRINFDGVITSAKSLLGNTNRSSSYCQVFRSGRVEAVRTDFARAKDNQQTVSSGSTEMMILDPITFYFKGLQELGVTLPILTLVAISGTKNASFFVNEVDAAVHDRTIDRDLLLLPDVLIETYAPDVPTLLRPVLDAVSNSAGLERSCNYDEKGIFHRPSSWNAHY